MIYRGCRYALLPISTSPESVRNFTTYASPIDKLPALKKQYAEHDFVKEFQKVELPELETITEINESFRQKLFVDWLTSPAKFKDLNAKLKHLTPKVKVSKVEYIDPNDKAAIKDFEELVVAVELNKTSTIRVLVPQHLRDILFEGWEEKGMELVRLLFHYGELFDWKLGKYLQHRFAANFPN